MSDQTKALARGRLLISIAFVMIVVPWGWTGNSLTALPGSVLLLGALIWFRRHATSYAGAYWQRPRYINGLIWLLSVMFAILAIIGVLAWRDGEFS